MKTSKTFCSKYGCIIFLLLSAIIPLVYCYWYTFFVIGYNNSINDVDIGHNNYNGTNIHHISSKKELFYGIMTIDSKFEFRMLMRAYLEYEQPSLNYGIDVRFIICIPRQEYNESVIAENKTYGDIVILYKCKKENISKGKLFQYLDYIASNSYLSNVYKYVGKYDDDTFTNFKNLYLYLQNVIKGANDSYFGQCIHSKNNTPTVSKAYTFAHNTRTSFYMAGCCYAMSMDIVQWITSNKSFAYYHRSIRADDPTTAIWLINDQKGLNTKCFVSEQMGIDYAYCRDIKKFKGFCSLRRTNFRINKNKMIHLHYAKTKESWINISSKFYPQLIHDYKRINFSHFTPDS